MDGDMTPAPTEHLDPSILPENAEIWVNSFDLPHETLIFGHYPKVDALLPGDLILTSDLKPDWISRLIQKVQSGPNAHWTHVAMYMGGRGQIVESTFDSIFDADTGVKVGLLSDYCKTHKIMVRRISDKWLCGPQASREECMAARWQLVVSAMKQMRRPYGFSSLLSFFRRANYTIRVHTKRKGLVCSTLYESAVVDATGRILLQGAESVTPAMLAGTTFMDTVSIPWVKIGRKIPI